MVSFGVGDHEVVKDPVKGVEIRNNGFVRSLNRPEFCIMSSKILRGLRDASTQGIYA